MKAVMTVMAAVIQMIALVCRFWLRRANSFAKEALRPPFDPPEQGPFAPMHRSHLADRSEVSIPRAQIKEPSIAPASTVTMLL
jgi:hypothetical protein